MVVSILLSFILDEDIERGLSTMNGHSWQLIPIR